MQPFTRQRQLPHIAKQRTRAVAKKHRPHPPRRLFSIRSVVIMQLAVLTAVGAAALLMAGHRPIAQAALGALGVLGIAVRFFNEMIV